MGKSFGFGPYGSGPSGHDHFGAHGFGGQCKMQNQGLMDQSGSSPSTQ